MSRTTFALPSTPTTSPRPSAVSSKTQPVMHAHASPFRPAAETATSCVIADDGPGIPEDLQTEVLARGRRLDETRPGSGLGLAIVADIADAWGGSIGFERNTELFSAILRLKAVRSR